MSRYAILCGLDYDSIDSNNNDNKSNYNIANMYNFLVQKCEYSTQNINIISDCINLSRKSTSRLNILNCITSLVNQCKSGDSIFLYYCGHGSFKTQRDVFDNIIVSNDNKSSGCIENDLLYKILIQNLQPNITLYIFFDCCQSAPMFNLPYHIEPNIIYKPQTTMHIPTKT